MGGDPDSVLKKDRVEDRGLAAGDAVVVLRQTEVSDLREHAGHGSESAVGLVDEGTHGLAKLGQVPLFELRIPEGCGC